MKGVFVFIVLALIGCTETLPDSVVIENVTVIEYTEPETEEPVVDEPEEPEIIIEEVLIMEIKAIESFEKYVVLRGETETKVYGISEKELTHVFLTDTEDNKLTFESFTKSGDDLFFSCEYFEQGAEVEGSEPVQYEAVAVTRYYQQTEEAVVEITENDMPDISESEQIEFRAEESEGFRIVNETYEDLIISKVFHDTKNIAYMPINSCYEVKDGLWYTVTETISTRLKGLYFMGLNGNARHALDAGVIE